MKAVLTVLAVVLMSCGGPAHVRDPSDEVAIEGFVYQAPGLGWEGIIYPPTERGTISHHYKRDGHRLQMQVDLFSPATSVGDQAAILAWTNKASGGHAVPDYGRGAICARYGRRWMQTFSLSGQSAQSSAIEERGLYCITPNALSRLIQVRIFERLGPDEQASPEFDHLAKKLLSGVRARAL